MSCFRCVNAQRKETRKKTPGAIDDNGSAQFRTRFLPADSIVGRNRKGTSNVAEEVGNDRAMSFSFKELATATQNFKECNLIGEGGFGKVFKGRLESGKVVAIKQLNHHGVQGSKEFLNEVLMLSILRHCHLVSLIGYCMDGDERLLVYEYMLNGSLENHLFDLPADKKPLEWNTRIKIAVGAAKGLEFLHDGANPPVIYRDLKSANILMDGNFNPKISDFGLAKLAPVGDKTHVSTSVMGTYGYCAPDYASSGKLTTKSDIYSFGVVLLELITGRRAYDSSRQVGEQNLISWSRRFLNDKRRESRLADPLLQGRFPVLPFHQLIVIASMCLQEQPTYRPIIHDVVVALEHVALQRYVAEVDGQTLVAATLFRSSPSPARELGSTASSGVKRQNKYP